MPVPEMEYVNEILNYSFHELGNPRYIDEFFGEREEFLNKLCVNNETNHVLWYVKDPKQVANIISRENFANIPEEHVSGDPFETFIFLGVALSQIAEKSKIYDTSSVVINRLQKKFENFHRLFSRYDSNFKKVGDSFKSVQIYSLLSVILNLRFSFSGNFNDLNTSIKLNDLVIKSGWDFEDVYKNLISCAFYLETRTLKTIYATPPC